MRILFIGTGDIGIPAFRFLATRPEHKLIGLVTGEDKKVGREQKLTPPGIKVVALEFDVPVFQPAKINTADALDQIDELVPDLIIVMAYGQILPGAVLRAPRRACLNLHASLLPRHRGASPIQAAIRAGDEETGVTVMHVARGLDTGDILCVERIPLDPTRTGGQLHEQLAQLAPRALAAALEYFEDAAKVPSEPQDHEVASYLGKLSREDGKIDWALPAIEIERMVRAFDPWPGCYTELPEGKKLKIYPQTKVREKAGEDGGAEPGTVLSSDHDEEIILVACGEGTSLAISQVQLEGRKRLPVKEFLIGHPLAAGTVLGACENTDESVAGLSEENEDAKARAVAPEPAVEPERE